jgi:prephenate dehydrogenase
MIKNAVIIGGAGQAGELLIRSLLDGGVAITIVDLTPPAASGPEQRYIQGNVRAIDRELEQAIHDSDCVCICLPERVALDSAPRLAAAMADGALWVDTLSIKGPITKALEMHSRRIEILSINPMFAPALGWKGRPVAVVEIESPGSRRQYFKQLLTEWGASVETITAEEHDRLTAALQVATHAAALAFGSSLLNSSYNLKAALRLATPPHRMLLGLLYRISSQNPEVYWDIQAHHPHAAEVRQQLINSLEHIETQTAQGDFDGFKRVFQEICSLLSPSGDELEGLTKNLIGATQRPR